jgi:hypothetical protein
MYVQSMGSHPLVYEALFWGAQRLRNLTLCWAPIVGSAFTAYLVLDPGMTGYAPPQIPFVFTS